MEYQRSTYTYIYFRTTLQRDDAEPQQIWIMCGCCIYNETQEERSINMSDSIFKTMDSDVEQTRE